MKIDYISDLHLDFHIKYNGNYEKWENKTQLFLEKLSPDTKGEVLVIAGDLSHYNIQSKWCLEYFSKQYEHVFFVLGNHDYYLVSNGQRDKYKKNSKAREYELQSLIFHLTNVTMLYNFKPFIYKGLKFSGSTSWYPLTEFNVVNFFNTASNDSRLIYGMNIGNENYHEGLAYENMEEVDVLITHVPSILINSHHKYGNSSCYLNELKQIKAKHNIFGHCHEQSVYDKAGIKFYINALSYPNEWANHMNPLEYSKEERQKFASKWNTIKSFEVK
ncbi:metallophosphoesterase [Lysinibacillus capsici]|uniref:metallophosphoesterase family protein n=1 Tax=Lysinibacillus capsici TaxID=2115968 RepID=UPI0021D7FD21|nr:metallophosphoesterase [Lysinibacillus capsici]UYB48783.1 metallophosphoesterase [Lysinibacillus capsici]